jgi:hypothetical protein
LKTYEIGVFTVLGGQSVGLSGFALSTPFFFFSLFPLQCLLSIAFSERRFSWSSDDALLSAFDARTIRRVTLWRLDVVSGSVW